MGTPSDKQTGDEIRESMRVYEQGRMKGHTVKQILLNQIVIMQHLSDLLCDDKPVLIEAVEETKKIIAYHDDKDK